MPRFQQRLIANHFRSVGHFLRVQCGQLRDGRRGKAKLGVVLGVLFPCLQTLLGVVLFLRTTWIFGMMGVGASLAMILICCLDTFLMVLSLSAVATNCLIGNGGTCYLLSRNLGSCIGTSLCLVLYLGQIVGTAMSIVGCVEILLIQLVPQIVIGGNEALESTGLSGAMANNFRLYGSILLLILFSVNSLGIRFTQLFAPISLACVFICLFLIFVGSLVHTIYRDTGPSICVADQFLLEQMFFLPSNESADEVCYFCNANVSSVIRRYCNQRNIDCNTKLKCLYAIPGFNTSIIRQNLYSRFTKEGQSAPGVEAIRKAEVFQDESTNFFVLLAIFFPGVIGIISGVAMSGDLKDPQRAIPKGCIATQIITSLLYLTMLFVLSGTVRGQFLRDKYGFSVGGGLVISKLAWPTQYVVSIGAFAATVGGALQGLCGAPRMLLSIACDDVIKVLRPFRKVTKRNEPLIGLVFSTGLVWCFVMIGRFDNIAPMYVQCFLLMHIAINFICFTSAMLDLPNWRPRFKFYHPLLSLCGLMVALFLMFSTHWEYGLGLLTILFLLCLSIHRFGTPGRWGDIIEAAKLSLAAVAIPSYYHCRKNKVIWRKSRPFILALISELSADFEIHNFIRFAGHLSPSSTITLNLLCMATDWSQICRNEMLIRKERIGTLLDGNGSRLFIKSLFYPGTIDMADILTNLVKTIGLSTWKTDTLMIRLPSQPYFDQLWRAVNSGNLTNYPLLIVSGEWPACPEILKGTIDIWWLVCDGGSFLLHYARKFHKTNCLLRLFAVAASEVDTSLLEIHINEWLEYMKVKAQVFVLTQPNYVLVPFIGKESQNVGCYINGNRLEFRFHDTRPLNSLITSYSITSDLVVINIPKAPYDTTGLPNYTRYVLSLTSKLKRVIMIRCST